jgi:DNA-binding PadR family transcriptional regulator
MGPCSAYEVRRHMQESPSTQWSGSAGAIYPLMRRLERAGLLRGRVRKAGKRAGREYQVTPAGIKALRAWVGPPLAAEAVTVAHDPLRSRARFLEALPVRQRLAWIQAARAALDEVERRVRAWEAVNGKRVGLAAELMTLSGEGDVRGRREWVDEVRRMVNEGRS